LEDLWEFNEEMVARAIAASRIPVVTGIGHEVDVSIADLVADYHAHTPTEAAQVVTRQWVHAKDNLDASGIRIRRALRGVVQEARQRLTAAARHEMFRRPLDRINSSRQFLDDRQRALALAAGSRLRTSHRQVQETAERLQACRPQVVLVRFQERVGAIAERLRRRVADEVERRRTRVNLLEKHLEAINPLAVLNRGYTITSRKKDGQIVRSAKEVRSGQRIITRFADGKVESVTRDSSQGELFEQ
jgi:exodeoxyribonuclease VII large subunit